MLIRVVREAGGLGDLVRLMAVFAGLKKKYPGAEIHFYCLEHFRELVMPMCGGLIDKYYCVPVTSRRARLSEINEDEFPYLKRGIRYDLTFDMYCPAYLHEIDTYGAVTTDRTRLWCNAADVEFSYPKLNVPERERQFARDWIEKHSEDPDQLVAIQPFGTSLSRNWPVYNWKELISKLTKAGLSVVAFDCCGRIRHLNTYREWNLSYCQLAGLLQQCSLCISGDSGLFHVAAGVRTMALGLFGPTSGEVMCKGWPDGLTHYLHHAEPWLVEERPEECIPICYSRPARGWSQTCIDAGCFILNAITPETVMAKVCEIYAPKSGSKWKPDNA